MNRSIADGERLFAVEDKPKKIITVILNLGIVVLACLLIFYYIFGMSHISGSSMENTIKDDQYAFTQKNGFRVKRGDIVTLNVAESGETHILIKRIIAVGGDSLLFVRETGSREVNIYLKESDTNNYKLLDEPYIKEEMLVEKHYGVPLLEVKDGKKLSDIDVTETYDEKYLSELVKDIDEYKIEIPENCFFYLGDNRNHSSDARLYGIKSQTAIFSKVITILEKNSRSEKFFKFVFNFD